MSTLIDILKTEISEPEHPFTGKTALLAKLENATALHNTDFNYDEIIFMNSLFNVYKIPIRLRVPESS
jgi:hypothetical protein